MTCEISSALRQTLLGILSGEGDCAREYEYDGLHLSLSSLLLFILRLHIAVKQLIGPNCTSFLRRALPGEGPETQERRPKLWTVMTFVEHMK
jgi:hypothetical protein